MRPRIAIGRSYKPLLTRRYPFVLIEGPRGTSKTRTILSILLARMLKHPGSRTLLFREYRSELTKTILTTLEDEVFPAFGMTVPGGAHRDNRSEYVLDNGSKFFLAGLHEGSGALSMGMTFAYGAEVLQMSERQVTDVAGCLRWTQSPEQPLLPDYSQLICDENPGPPGHWANKKAEPVDDRIRIVRTREDYERLQQHNLAEPADPVNRWKRIITKIQDNPGYWNHDVWDYWPLGRRYITETLGTLSGYQRARWIDGLHTAADGTVFPEFNTAEHVVDHVTIDSDWPCFLFYDAGFDHPTAAIWVTVAPNGCYYVFDEIYEGGKSVAQHGAEIMRRNREAAERGEHRTMRRYYGDPQHCFSKTAQAPESIAAQFKKATTLSMTPWPRSTDKHEMVNAVRQRLQERKLKVLRSCVNTISEFQSWKFRRTAGGETPKGDDAYEDADNHAMDCLCGAASLNLKPAGIGRTEIRDRE